MLPAWQRLNIFWELNDISRKRTFRIDKVFIIQLDEVQKLNLFIIVVKAKIETMGS